ncbi:MAG: HPr family phosphocarrier protein [Bacteroidetes bacterium]|nr:HPr family phosphocarrier protein [Bacteroidota bacterium]
MIQETLTVLNRAGLHTRPAAMLVKLAAKFKSDIYLNRDGYDINAKSIIGVMTLAAEQGSELILTTEGTDEQDAMTELKALFESGFGEL